MQHLDTRRWILWASLTALPAIVSAQTPCEQLRTLKLADTTITLAESSGPGAFPLPGGGAPPPLPAFCRVAATLKPSPDSEIKIDGMEHCGGGPGPSQFNALAALERWRESGIAPDRITAYHVENNRVTMTRPLCPYPKVAVYDGIGSTNDAANFVCKAP
jgi:hypothetical protein